MQILTSTKQLKRSVFILSFLMVSLFSNRDASAVLLTNPDDARTWQGAGVGTFAALLNGGVNDATTRQAVIDAGLLDDGEVNTSGVGAGSYYGLNLGCSGSSSADGTYGYSCGNESLPVYTGRANALDWQWIQDTGDGGTTWEQGNVWDLGGPANQAVVFPIIDHGPLPQEAIEYTVYLSNNPFATTLGLNGSVDWVRAELKRVFLEGWDDTQIADGFTTLWRLSGDQEFRYVNVFAGGPGALHRDGDDEIDTVAGLRADGTPSNPTNGIPEPATMMMMGLGLAGFAFGRRKNS